MTLNPTFTEVYAVPGKQNIIDNINPVTGLTQCYGETEAELQARYPGAVRMLWEDWQRDASARQHTPIVWEPSTAEQYHDMLNILPPAMWIGGAFLVGEPMDHDLSTGEPRFTAYLSTRANAFFVASRPLTRAELRAVVQG